jgi:hypothetical protein
LILVLFISDLLKINPSNIMLIAFSVPFLLVYFLFYKFFPKDEVLKLSTISTIIGIFFIIGSCAFFVSKLSNSPYYW